LLVTRVDRTVEEPPPAGMSFFQYAFTEEDFAARLERAGFVVERTFGYGLLWGLMELPRFQQLYQRSFAAAKQLRDLVRARRGSDDSHAPASAGESAGSGGAGES